MPLWVLHPAVYLPSSWKRASHCPLTLPSECPKALHEQWQSKARGRGFRGSLPCEAHRAPLLPDSPIRGHARAGPGIGAGPRQPQPLQLAGVGALPPPRVVVTGLHRAAGLGLPLGTLLRAASQDRPPSSKGHGVRGQDARVRFKHRTSPALGPSDGTGGAIIVLSQRGRSRGLGRLRAWSCLGTGEEARAGGRPAARTGHI